jgi:2-keto-4-pentenoate hydratase/2-oxohepta-3-ene-1,7-dioic acid hydratase in catechol pathway
LPLSRVRLQAPVPEPRLLLGVVGNNPGFLRMDPGRGRNLQQPKCHQRTQTSIVGPGQPIVLPGGGEQWAGTTELGVVIGRGGKNIPREMARTHVAGYTVINDGLGSLFARRWAELDRIDGGGRGHYHAANTASWLDKKGDTMLAMGPWLVTADEIADPYDLLAWYREGGMTRHRGHTGALCTGVEELIHWLSKFLTLEPGMVLHLGATGQDGLVAAGPQDFSAAYTVECEIERIGVLRNPLVAPAVADWRPEDDPGRKIHPSPMVRRRLAAGAAALRREEWKVGEVRHFWTVLGNSREGARLERTTPRPYPLAYNAPAAALGAPDRPVVLPAGARRITGVCELGVVIGSVTRNVTPDEANRHILGLVVLATLRDSSFAEDLVQPHVLQAPIPDIYGRWPEGFNVAGTTPVAADHRNRRMSFEIEGLGRVEHSTADYLLTPAQVIAELSRGITLLPGDVIALGLPGAALELPADRPLDAGSRLRAAIEGVGDVSAPLVDERASAAPTSRGAS